MCVSSVHSWTRLASVSRRKPWGEWRHFWFIVGLIVLGFGTLFAARFVW